MSDENETKAPAPALPELEDETYTEEELSDFDDDPIVQKLVTMSMDAHLIHLAVGADFDLPEQPSTPPTPEEQYAKKAAELEGRIGELVNLRRVVLARDYDKNAPEGEDDDDADDADADEEQAQ
jgi:hypothetical protein